MGVVEAKGYRSLMGGNVNQKQVSSGYNCVRAFFVYTEEVKCHLETFSSELHRCKNFVFPLKICFRLPCLLYVYYYHEDGYLSQFYKCVRLLNQEDLKNFVFPLKISFSLPCYLYG